VRVGVTFFRLAVRGPAGVADAALPCLPSARRQLSCSSPFTVAMPAES
jgi:hypothetical protein